MSTFGPESGSPAGFEPVPLADSLDTVVRGLRAGPDGGGATANHTLDARSLGSLYNKWAEAVGPTVAEHARPIKLDGQRLLVEVDEPGWATQLKFLERNVIDRLLTVAGLQVSRFDVRVKQR